jgi:SpoVK/Ycf46/Vps4 family AAA+-type ATPase
MVPFPSPDAAARRAVWRRELAEAGLSVAEPVISHLAGQYRLGPARIAEAVTEVALVVPDSVPDALAAAARRQSGHDLERLTRRVAPTFGWDDLVLPAATRRLLRELTDRVLHRQRVLVEWQFERVLALGRGTCALFAGPSGTGKSMAAGVIAAELGLDLYEINLATVVSKYIGETEQNLERIFTAAERTDAVLFFDEADALFGKRSDVTDAHDRYANLEIAYLLRRMEQYEGVAILATNLRENLDDAFLRRLHFVVDFPMPADDDRERMWRRFIPAGAPVADGIDYGFLAGRFGLSGGNIKNIVVSAAFLASANGGRIGMPHLIRATWGEHRKIGRVLSATDAGEYGSLVPTPDPDWVG